MIPAKRKFVKEEDPTINSMGEEIASMSRLIRDVQPANYLLKIKSFSVLLESKIKMYESNEFESGGYKWKLHFYPNGKNDGNGSNYISLYLAISDTNILPQGWEVNVQFKLFVYDHIKDKYLTIQESDRCIRRFHVMKTEWGFDQLLPLDLFKNISSGYLFEDSCVFGVEILVIKYGGLGQCLDMKKGITNANTYTWKIERFSTIKEEVLESKEFKIGELQWKMLVYPEGMSNFKGSGISLFLKVADYSKLPLKTRVYAEYKLRIKSQINPSQLERAYARWFCDSYGYGNPNFMSLSYLKNKSNGCIVNDTLVVEVEISIIGVTKNLS